MAGVRHQDLERDHAPRPSAARQQRLADDALEHQRQLRADLRLLVRREDVDDAVDRLRRRVGVQRRERQVAGLGDAQRRLDRLEVAHFADEDDVGVLAQRGAQRHREAVGVGVHLALVHEAASCAGGCTRSGPRSVRMCSRRSVLILSIIAASVVDLPLPVGPVTSTRPRGRSEQTCR